MRVVLPLPGLLAFIRNASGSGKMNEEARILVLSTAGQDCLRASWVINISGVFNWYAWLEDVCVKFRIFRRKLTDNNVCLRGCFLDDFEVIKVPQDYFYGWIPLFEFRKWLSKECCDFESGELFDHLLEDTAANVACRTSSERLSALSKVIFLVQL